MKRNFKDFEEAEKYFSVFDITKLKSPQDFAIIIEIATVAQNLNPKLSVKSLKFWKELEKDVKALMEEKGVLMIEIYDENINQAVEKLKDTLTPSQLADLLIKISDFSAFSNQDINDLYAFISKMKGKKIAELRKMLEKERFIRNKDMN